ncbi:ATP-dependent RNA helicase DDX24 isoform X2 [Halyomorpha halys]|uniref:ATP-dependent RNA helicase DDX24 isoform X2 n=1 Tax=Halyomorpha halys TaxID=286706 RepID=UPI0034D2F46A
MASSKKAQWQPVEIDVEGDFEGLAGIEEISDYNHIDIISIYNIESFRTEVQKQSKLDKKKKKKKKTVTAKNNFVEEEIEQKEIEETQFYPWNNIYVPVEVSRALLEEGFMEPTEIQRLTIPPALKGKRDILGAAETGSGKTLAFAIPIIYGIMKNLELSSRESDKENEEEAPVSKNKLWALILTPTRELAIQVKNHIATAIKYTPLKVAVIVGGMSADKQSRLLKGEPHIVVATPGRLWDLLNSNEPHLAEIENIRFLVIDETDRMIETNHFPELRTLLLRINNDEEKMKKRQNFVFSATLSLVHQLPAYTKKRKRGKKIKKDPTPEKKLEGFIKLIGMTNPKIVDITKKTGMATGLQEAKILSVFEEKDFYLYYLLSVYPGRSLVFCNSISCVRRLASLLTALDMKPLPLHANMQQRQRLKNLDRFKSNPKGLLLATDVAARGLDIPSVEHVIHYQVPRTSETYIHRSGRTARAQRTGLTVLLIETNEIPVYSRICTTLARDKDVPDLNVDLNLLKMAKERVKLARQIDRISLDIKKEKSKIGWIEKTAEEMELVLDDDQLPSRSDDYEVAKKRKTLDLAKKQLKELLNVPMVSKSASGSLENINNVIIPQKRFKILKKKRKVV